MSETQHPSDQPSEREPISRRSFIQAIAAGGAALSLSGLAFAQAPATSAAQPQSAAPAGPSAKNEPELNVALIGAGQMGRVMMDACRGIPGLRFQAVCDIWEYSQQYARGKLRAMGHKDVRTYQDYREMLDKEKGLHAVLVATPDWMHAEHTIACLDAGLHVYCEADMAPTLEEAKLMVIIAREKRRLLQIGRQRRSNPRYQFALNKIIRGQYLLGRVNEVNAQWNRARQNDYVMPKKFEVPQTTLRQYGYRSFHEFLNWRGYRKYSNGPFASLAGHQLDVLNWFLGTCPRTLMATGSRNSFKNHECLDNVMCLLEYEPPAGPVRAFYQVLSNTGHGGYHETFMGEQGALVMSESDQKTRIFREAMAVNWDPLVATGVLKNLPAPQVGRTTAPAGTVNNAIDTGICPSDFTLPVVLNQPFHQPHLENFFSAVRHGTPLTCPGEIGYATTVLINAIERAVAGNTKIDFSPDDFIVS